MIQAAFARYFSQGLSVSDALHHATEATASDVSFMVGTGTPLIDALAQTGLRVRESHILLPTMRDPSESEILKLIMDPDITSIPAAACMAANLPKDRTATPDEILEAWRVCTSK